MLGESKGRDSVITPVLCEHASNVIRFKGLYMAARAQLHCCDAYLHIEPSLTRRPSSQIQTCNPSASGQSREAEERRLQ